MKAIVLLSVILCILLCRFGIVAESTEHNEAKDEIAKAKPIRFPTFSGIKKRFNTGVVSSFALGGAILSGGVMGYVSKKSVPSLVGSAVLGGSLLGGSALIAKDEQLAGHTLSATASGGIAAIGAWRYMASKKAIPGLPLMVLGAISTIYHAREVVVNVDKPFPDDLENI